MNYHWFKKILHTKKVEHEFFYEIDSFLHVNTTKSYINVSIPCAKYSLKMKNMIKKTLK